MSEKLIVPNLLVPALIICSQSDNCTCVVSGSFQLKWMYYGGKEKTGIWVTLAMWLTHMQWQTQKSRRFTWSSSHFPCWEWHKEVTKLCSAKHHRKCNFNWSASQKSYYELRCSPHCTQESASLHFSSPSSGMHNYNVSKKVSTL